MRFERGWLIGDPHLGRKFEVGVPAHRRGEREARQLALFVEELNSPGDMVVMVGDLFDNPYVSHRVVKQAIDAVLGAATNRPGTTFVMMAGNHDMPRKIGVTSAFDVFRRACDRRLDNVHVLTGPAVVGEVAFFPWEWHRTSVEQVEDVRDAQVVAAVGHWDLSSFGGEDLHIAPVAALRDALGSVPLYSGHYHTPGDYQVERVVVHCVGSLEPYGHGEDPDGLIYVTVTREEALSSDLRDKCVRVLLAPGEEKPVIDALAVTVVPAAAGTEEQTDVGDFLGVFDWAGIVRHALAPLDAEVRAFIQERIPSHDSQHGADSRKAD